MLISFISVRAWTGCVWHDCSLFYRNRKTTSCLLNVNTIVHVLLYSAKEILLQYLLYGYTDTCIPCFHQRLLQCIKRYEHPLKTHALVRMRLSRAESNIELSNRNEMIQKTNIEMFISR